MLNVSQNHSCLRRLSHLFYQHISRIVGRLYASVTYARQHDYNRTHYENTGINQKTQNKTKP